MSEEFNLDHYHGVIRETLKELDLDPEECYNSADNYYSMSRGSADVFISLFTIERPDEPPEWYIEWSSPVMKLPSSDLLPFYRRLLEENAHRVAIKFSIKEEAVWLEITRELSGVDTTECYRNLTRIGDTADELDDALREEFF
ncbi:MAG: YbjN domain-containing protein [bacterium]|nr:YbjN domain-containing protein [bacterium]